jgi:hypothetical protein
MLVHRREPYTLMRSMRMGIERIESVVEFMHISEAYHLFLIQHQQMAILNE